MAWLNSQADRGPFQSIDLYVDERGDTDHIQPIEDQESPSDGQGLNRLVDRSSPDCLYIRTTVLTDDTRNGPGDGW
jgi:hypothetical protein